MKNNNVFSLCLIIAFFGFYCLSAVAQALPKKGAPPQRIYGLTIENLDNLNVNKFEQKLRDVTVPITLRIVFQSGNKPEDYKDNIKALRGLKDARGNRRFYILGLPFDSTALKEHTLAANPNENFDCKLYTPSNKIYDHRAKCFVEYYKKTATEDRDFIDAWEVGNEVNGEWADEDYQEGVELPPNTKGKPERTIEKISRLINLVPADKPLMLTISYMPNCGEWTANSMSEWIKNIPQTMVDKIDYVLISYYEDKCNYKVLRDDEISANVLEPLKVKFPQQFIAFGEIGYSVGKGESSRNCRDKTCYCSVKETFCDESQTGEKKTCKKSKISQMQRYYSYKSAYSQYVGGGFWWNAGEDYKVDDFLTALKNQFNCLKNNSQCALSPVDCR